MKAGELEKVKKLLPLSAATLARNPTARSSVCPQAPPGGKTLREVFAEEEQCACKVRICPTKDELGLNKTERAYYELLKTQGHPWIGVHCITLKLADDTRYTCDFYIVNKECELVGLEVKGFMQDDARVKVYVAAREFRFIKFYLVRKIKGGWDHKQINP
jgi:hypothetical protein